MPVTAPEPGEDLGDKEIPEEEILGAVEAKDVEADRTAKDPHATTAEERDTGQTNVLPRRPRQIRPRR